MPSSTSGTEKSFASGAKSFKKSNFFDSKRSVILPKLSFIFTPLYNPIEINKKKAKDKIVVDSNEFSKTEL